MNKEVEIQIRDAEARLSAAMVASNTVELDALIAEDLLFVGPNGGLVTKAMDLELHRTGNTQFDEVVTKELEIRLWSQEFVLVSAKTFLKGQFFGNGFAGDYRYMRIWRKQGGGWQVVGGSVSAIF